MGLNSRTSRRPPEWIQKILPATRRSRGASISTRTRIRVAGANQRRRENVRPATPRKRIGLQANLGFCLFDGSEHRGKISSPVRNQLQVISVAGDDIRTVIL